MTYALIIAKNPTKSMGNPCKITSLSTRCGGMVGQIRNDRDIRLVVLASIDIGSGLPLVWRLVTGSTLNLGRHEWIFEVSKKVEIQLGQVIK